MNAQQAARANNATVILDDYNPFDEDEKSNSKSQYMAGGTNPMAPKSPPQIPAYNQSAGGHHQQPSTNQAYGSAGSAAPQISTAELQVSKRDMGWDGWVGGGKSVRVCVWVYFCGRVGVSVIHVMRCTQIKIWMNFYQLCYYDDDAVTFIFILYSLSIHIRL